MKKFVVTILILLMIFIGMYIYRKNTIINSQKKEINVEEVTKIETYMQEIYMWKEVTKDALPEFENINQAPELWIWEVVKKNMEQYELTYDEIQNKAKEIFGNEFNKEFPKDGYEYMKYDDTKKKYIASGTTLDKKDDSFLLDTITKDENGYTVKIIEYLEDYSGLDESQNTEYNIKIENLNEQEIGEVKSTEDESNIQSMVKQNIDKFTKKEVRLEKDENGNIYVTSVKNI